MKKKFIICLLSCLLVTVGFGYSFYNNQLKEPFIFDLNDKYYTHTQTTDYLAIPYLTNKHDDIFITHINLDEFILYPKQFAGNPFGIQTNNFQFYQENGLYNLNFASLELSTEQLQLLANDNKSPYNLQIHFSNGTTQTKLIKIAFIEFIDRTILTHISGSSSSTGEVDSTFRATADLVITKIYELGSPYPSEYLLKNNDSFTFSSLPIEFNKGDKLTLQYNTTIPSTPQYYNDYNFLIIEGFVKNSGESFKTDVIYQSGHYYPYDYFVNYLKELK